MKRIFTILAIFFLGFILFDSLEKNREKGMKEPKEKIEKVKVEKTDGKQKEKEEAKVDSEIKKEEPTPKIKEKAKITGTKLSFTKPEEKKPIQTTISKSTNKTMSIPTTKIIAPAQTIVATPKTKQVSTIEPQISDQVKVYMYEWGIDVSQKNLRAGLVEFEVINNGRLSHNFSLEGIGNFGKVLPQERKRFTATIKPGYLNIYSEKKIDIERGMTNNVSVYE